MTELLFLRAFGQLSGKVFGAHNVTDLYVAKGVYQHKQVDITYKDTKETKYVNGKPRRIFELEKISARQTP